MLALHVCLLALPRAGEQGLSPLPASASDNGGPDNENPEDEGKWYPHGDLTHFCNGNIVDREAKVCCQLACGQCGGAHCSDAEGGAEHCCQEDILHGKGDNTCKTEEQFCCVMPLTCLQDQCLPMCPLHPGCSIIWESRGLDYETVRREYKEAEAAKKDATKEAAKKEATKEAAKDPA